FGWSAVDVIGRPLPIVPPERVGEFESVRQRALAGESLPDQEEEFVHRSGRRVAASLSAALLRHADGSLRGFMAVVADVTERNLAEENRRRLLQEQAARHEAEEAHRRKDQFLAMLAHELRNPLAAISNASFVLDQLS